MAQSWNLPIITGESFTAALQTKVGDALEALRTCHSGASEPTSKVAYMLWADTTNGLMKQRNAANSAWTVVGPLNARTDYVTPTVYVGGFNASVNFPIWVPPAIAKVEQLVIQSNTSTSGSTGANNWGFNVTDVTAAANMLLTDYTTDTAELAAGVATIVTLTESQNVAAGSFIQVAITKTGTPTDLSAAKITLGLVCSMRGT